MGFHRYTFPASDAAAIVFDLENGGCWDKATQTHIEAESDRTLTGWRHSSGWAKDQKVYFMAEFSKPFTFEQVGEHYARASFRTDEGEQVLVKVALSPVSVEGARENLVAELPGWASTRPQSRRPNNGTTSSRKSASRPPTPRPARFSTQPFTTP